MTHAPTDEEIKALCERLRSGLNRLGYAFRNKTADALEALTEQVAELREQVCRWQALFDDKHQLMLDWKSRAEAAEKRLAEVEAERDDILADSRLMTHHRKKQGDSDTRIIESLQAHRDRLEIALREIIARSHNDSLGTSKVIDMRKIADAALSGSDVVKTAPRLNFFGQDGEFTFEWLGKNGPEAMISFEPDGTVGYALLDGDQYRPGKFSVWEQPEEAEKEIKEHLAKLDAVKTAKEDG